MCERENVCQPASLILYLVSAFLLSVCVWVSSVTQRFKLQKLKQSGTVNMLFGLIWESLGIYSRAVMALEADGKVLVAAVSSKGISYLVLRQLLFEHGFRCCCWCYIYLLTTLDADLDEHLVLKVQYYKGNLSHLVIAKWGIGMISVCVCVALNIHIVSLYLVLYVCVYREILIESHGRALPKMEEDCRQQMASKVILYQRWQ